LEFWGLFRGHINVKALRSWWVIVSHGLLNSCANKQTNKQTNQNKTKQKKKNNNNKKELDILTEKIKLALRNS